VGSHQVQVHRHVAVTGEEKMRLRVQLVASLNLFVSLVASFFTTQLFFSAKISNELIDLTINYLKALVPTHISSYVTGDIVRTAILVFILGFTLYNLWKGKTGNIKNIYYLCIIMILPEVFAHSKFEWLKILWDIELYSPSKSFTETLFTSLVIIGGYIFLYLDSNFREAHLLVRRRGITDAEIETVYSNQSLFSITLVTIAFFVILMLSFAVQIIVEPLHRYVSLNNLNYVLFGVISSFLLASTLYIYLREQAK